MESRDSVFRGGIGGIAKGKVTFSDEDDEIRMEPEGLLRLKLTATREENRRLINIRISWQVEEEMQKQQKSLSVSSDC